MTLTQLRAAVIAITNRSDKSSLIDAAINTAQRRIATLFDWPELLEETRVALNVGDTQVDLPSGTRHITEVRLINGQLSYPLPVKPRKWVLQRYPNISPRVRFRHGDLTGNAFTAGMTVTQATSGATGTFISDDGTTMVIDRVSGAFDATHTITGTGAPTPTAPANASPNLTEDSLSGFPRVCYVFGGRLYVAPKSVNNFQLAITSVQDVATLSADADEPAINHIDDCLISYAAAFVYQSLQMTNEAIPWVSDFKSKLEEAIRSSKREPAIDYVFDRVNRHPLHNTNHMADPFYGFAEGVW